MVYAHQNAAIYNYPNPLATFERLIVCDVGGGTHTAS